MIHLPIHKINRANICAVWVAWYMKSTLRRRHAVRRYLALRPLVSDISCHLVRSSTDRSLSCHLSLRTDRLVLLPSQVPYLPHIERSKGYLQDRNLIPCREPQSMHGSETARDPPKPRVGNSNFEASSSVRGRVKDEPVNTSIGPQDVKPLGLSNNGTARRP